MMGEQWADGLGSKGYSKRLAGSHEWGSDPFLRPVLFNVFVSVLDRGLGLQTTLNWEEALTPSGAERPRREILASWRTGQLPTM